MNEHTLHSWEKGLEIGLKAGYDSSIYYTGCLGLMYFVPFFSYYVEGQNIFIEILSAFALALLSLTFYGYWLIGLLYVISGFTIFVVVGGFTGIVFGLLVSKRERIGNRTTALIGAGFVALVIVSIGYVVDSLQLSTWHTFLIHIIPVGLYVFLTLKLARALNSAIGSTSQPE